MERYFPESMPQIYTLSLILAKLDGLTGRSRQETVVSEELHSKIEAVSVMIQPENFLWFHVNFSSLRCSFRFLSSFGMYLLLELQFQQMGQSQASCLDLSIRSQKIEPVENFAFIMMAISRVLKAVRREKLLFLIPLLFGFTPIQTY